MSESYVGYLQNKVQTMQTAGDALAAAVAATLGPDHQLVQMWDEAKRYGEPKGAPA